MKISAKDKAVLFEQEFLALLLIIGLGFLFNELIYSPWFYLVTLAIGFALYFWMIHEEDVHRTGKKHAYFEHTSSYIMVGQTALALLLFCLHFNMKGFLSLIFVIISVVMYGVSLSRIILYKFLFRK
jgi:hypothetical protein